jgi:hypothetical protein
MYVSNTIHTLPNSQKALFKLEQNTKEVLLKSALGNLDKLINKRHWAIAEAGKTYLYAFLPPRAMQTSDKQNEFFNKYNNKIAVKASQALQAEISPIKIRHYNDYTNLFNWLQLADTWAKMWILDGLNRHNLLIKTVYTAIDCEYAISQVDEETKKLHLYRQSFDQFIEGREKAWKDNINMFKSIVDIINDCIKNLLYYNRTIANISKMINIEELTLLYIDVLSLITKTENLYSLISCYKKDIENNAIRYTKDTEKKLKIESVNSLLKIVDLDDLIKWITHDFNDRKQLPDIFKDGLNLAALI